MKKICMLTTGVIFTLFGYGQTTQKTVEKQITDPNRKANAGKADVITSNKKNVFDSTSFNNSDLEAGTNKMVKASTNPACSKTKSTSKAARSSKGVGKKG